MKNGRSGSAEWADEATKTLWNQGQRLLKKGTAIETAEETLAELTRRADDFAARRLPILRALQVV